MWNIFAVFGVARLKNACKNARPQRQLRNFSPVQNWNCPSKRRVDGSLAKTMGRGQASKNLPGVRTSDIDSNTHLFSESVQTNLNCLLPPCYRFPLSFLLFDLFLRRGGDAKASKNLPGVQTSTLTLTQIIRLVTAFKKFVLLIATLLLFF